MVLTIKEIAWGIDRMNGGYSERITANKDFPCVVGRLPEFEKGRRTFFIDEVGDRSIVLSIRFENNPAADKCWTLEKGEKQFYNPRSFDGGYKYEFKLKG